MDMVDCGASFNMVGFLSLTPKEQKTQQKDNERLGN